MARTARLPFLLLLLALTGVSCRVEERPPEEDPPPPPPRLPAEDPAAREPVEEEPQDPLEPSVPVLEVGDAFWAGDRTAGAELTGTFVSREALTAHLDRGSPVARTGDGRQWILADILVSVEFPDAGERAIWRVAGPSDVISTYLDRLRDEERSRERTPVRDLGILRLEVRQCCGGAPVRGRPPPEEEGGPL
jgi:hypothetical protein